MIRPQSMNPASEHKLTLVSRAPGAAKAGAPELQTPPGPASEPLGQRPLDQGRTAMEVSKQPEQTSKL
jgi:hypothetical protein